MLQLVIPPAFAKWSLGAKLIQWRSLQLVSPLLRTVWFNKSTPKYIQNAIVIYVLHVTLPLSSYRKIGYESDNGKKDVTRGRFSCVYKYFTSYRIRALCSYLNYLCQVQFRIIGYWSGPISLTVKSDDNISTFSGYQKPKMCSPGIRALSTINAPYVVTVLQLGECTPDWKVYHCRKIVQKWPYCSHFLCIF